MSKKKSKNSDSDAIETTEKSVDKSEEKSAEKSAEKREPQLVDYSSKGDTVQQVRAFGKDKQSLKARAAFHLFSFCIVNLKMSAVHPKKVLSLVTQILGFDMHSLYPGSKYPDSPIHQGFHCCSKGETNETKVSKEGVVTDTFARGQRMLFLKDVKVGLASDGMYRPNPNVEYLEQNEKELKVLLGLGFRDTLPQAKLELVSK